MPTLTTPPMPGGGEISLADIPRLGELRNGWVKGMWKDDGLWDAESGTNDAMRQRFGDYFRDVYREIVRVGANAKRAV